MTKKNLNALSKAELVALLTNMSVEAAVTPASPVAAPAPESDVVKELLATLALNRLKDDARGSDEDDNRLDQELINISEMQIGIEVRDPYTGVPRALSFERPGERKKVTKGQIRDLRMEYPVMFERGYLAVAGEEENNPNAVPDIEVLLKSLSIEDVNTYIETITSVDTLMKIFGWLEKRRYVNVDDDGKAIESTNSKGERVLTLEAKLLPPKEMTMLSAVTARVAKLSDMSPRSEA